MSEPLNYNADPLIEVGGAVWDSGTDRTVEVVEDRTAAEGLYVCRDPETGERHDVHSECAVFAWSAPR